MGNSLFNQYIEILCILTFYWRNSSNWFSSYHLNCYLFSFYLLIFILKSAVAYGKKYSTACFPPQNDCPIPTLGLPYQWPSYPMSQSIRSQNDETWSYGIVQHRMVSYNIVWYRMAYNTVLETNFLISKTS